MKGLPNPRDHRPRSRGLLAFALLLAWVLAPVLHTQFELVSAKPAVEHGHSDDCPRIHTDTFCLHGATGTGSQPRPVRLLGCH
jgi:hypothetical protein